MVGFDRLARVYDLLPIPTHPEALAARLEAVDGPRVDLGGGTGRFTARIHSQGSPVVIADASRGMLEQARRAERPVAGVQADGRGLPFADDAIGAVSITEAFHHFAPDQADVLAEVARVLRPEGALVVEEIDPEALLGRAIELGENLLLRFGSRFLRPGELATLAAGFFDDVQTARTGSFTYVVEAREPITPPS